VRLFLNPKLSKNLSPSSGEGTGFASCEMNGEFLKDEETINHRLFPSLEAMCKTATIGI